MNNEAANECLLRMGQLQVMVQGQEIAKHAYAIDKEELDNAITTGRTIALLNKDGTVHDLVPPSSLSLRKCSCNSVY